MDEPLRSPEEARAAYDAAPWLASYPPDVPPHLEYPEAGLPELLERAVREAPEREAIRFFGRSIRYRQLGERVRRLAAALAARGVTRGERVAVMLPNTPQLVVAYFAALRLGAVVTLVNPLYTAREVRHQLADSGARWLVALDLTWPRLETGLEGTAVERVILAAVEDELPFPLGFLARLRKPRLPLAPRVAGVPVERFPQLERERHPEPPAVRVEPGDLALLQYTGGTTGEPKGAMLTHRNLVANALQCIAWVGSQGPQRILGVLPLFHVYGLTTVLDYGVASASTLVLLPRFQVREVLAAIQKERPTLFPGAPTMYVAINTFPEVDRYDLSSIQACISGSAPLPVEVQKEFERRTGATVVEGYGLTEASPVTHANPFRGGPVRIGTIGLPWPDTEARVVDDARRPVPPGEVGELAVRGPQVMRGYWNRPEATAQVLDEEGWLYTGDLAVMEPDGYFRIVDRKKDVIIASGFNIYPREVEDVLHEHPAVQEAVVVGVPDPYRGETVKAFIKLRPGARASEAEIVAFCRERLTPYKVPRLVEFREELPKSTVGKLLRRVLVEEEAGRARGQGG
ncbi:MAG: long-chain fatty acid--CoA ligase [Clostridia bacterium]|nr:long-chain fatty acid--CoA ligase [Clostridia bacterium]MCL6522904.1 long-chain fatty acid--CoA ligase [Bacillota bacterium]